MENQNSVIPIVTAADENYAPYLSVMLTSVVENNPENRPLCFYVIDDGLSKTSKRHLETVISRKTNHATIQFLTIDRNIYQDFLVSDHITTTAYLRISLPKLLAGGPYDKILYLDADVLCLADVAELYDQPLNGNIVGAVIDVGEVNGLKRLIGDVDGYYFNSGVLLIDVIQWNAQAITEKTIDFLTIFNDRIVYHDQDALNAVLHGKWQPLHPRWNAQTALIFNKFPAPDSHYQTWYQECHLQPAIVHFTGHDKPWNTLVGHPYTQQYLTQLADNQMKKVGKVNG